MSMFFQLSGLLGKDLNFTGEDILIVFPNQYEIAIWAPVSNSFKTVFQNHDLEYKIDFDSVKIEENKILVVLTNESKAKIKLRSYEEAFYQTGSVINQKHFLVDILGNSILKKTVTLKALNDRYLESIEDYMNHRLSDTIFNIRKTNIFYRPEIQTAENNGTKLTVEHGSLYLEKQGLKTCLIKSTNDCNPKVGCGCYDPFINKNGTIGLCDYNPDKGKGKPKEKPCIVQIDLITGELIKYFGIYGSKPKLSNDGRFILVNRNGLYCVYEIEKKEMWELPCMFALWFSK